MIRLVLRWLDSPWAFELMPGLNTLGRNPTNDFRVSDPSVSSFHAEITVTAGSIRVRDLGSTNGTFVDERRIDDADLKPKSVLRLGNVRFQVDEVPVIPAAPAGPISAEDVVKEEDARAGSNSSGQVELAPGCMYHPGTRAVFRCENCAGVFCADCVRVVGQGKFEATTICPVCHGQCFPLAEPHPQEEKVSLLARLTQTLKIPFTR